MSIQVSMPHNLLQYKCEMASNFIPDMVEYLVFLFSNDC